MGNVCKSYKVHFDDIEESMLEAHYNSPIHPRKTTINGKAVMYIPPDPII